MFRAGQYLQDPAGRPAWASRLPGDVDAIGSGVDVAVGAPLAVVPTFTMNDYPSKARSPTPRPAR